MHKYPLIAVAWENGEGRLVYSVGWEISRDKDTLILASTLERHNPLECVAEGVVEIAIDNIHAEQHLTLRAEV